MRQSLVGVDESYVVVPTDGTKTDYTQKYVLASQIPNSSGAAPKAQAANGKQTYGTLIYDRGVRKFFKFADNHFTIDQNSTETYEDRAREVAETAKGYFVDAPVGAISGTYEFGRHPIQNLSGMVETIAAAQEDPEFAAEIGAAFRQSIADKWNSGNRGKGELIGNGVGAVLSPNLAGKALDLASDSSKLFRTVGKLDNVADSSVDAARAGRFGETQAVAPEGVVYKRTDLAGQRKPYIGQAKSQERFAARQKEHARKYPDSDFDFEIVDRADPGDALDIAEHNALQELTGGVKAKPSPLVDNLKDPVGPARRPGFGLPEPRDL